MPEIIVKLPSGKEITFPEGTPIEVVEVRAREAMKAEGSAPPGVDPWSIPATPGKAPKSVMQGSVPFKDGMRPDSGTNPLEQVLAQFAGIAGMAGLPSMGRKKAAPTPTPSAPSITRQRPILGSTTLDDEIAERVTKGGVQNDFRGRVSIQPGPQRTPGLAYPPNITTEGGMDEIMEMIMGLSREGQTPMKWADKANRNSVDRLKRQVQRRTPR